MGESAYLREIRGLDPMADHSRIVYLDTCFEFPWDTTRSLELALFRTFAVPSVAELLDRTGEFGRAGPEAVRRHGPDPVDDRRGGLRQRTGKRAIRQMNRIHGRFEIANEDFLYVLSSFVFEPIRWNARFGWRPLIETEKLATIRVLARGRAADGDPGRSRRATRSSSGSTRSTSARVPAHRGHRARGARDTRTCSRLVPRAAEAVRLAAIYALMDEPLLDAFGFPHPPEALRAAVEKSLRARGRVLARLPARRHPRHRTRRRTRTYGRGWELEGLGPSTGSRRCTRALPRCPWPPPQCEPTGEQRIRGSRDRAKTATNHEGYDPKRGHRTAPTLLEQAFPDATELAVIDRTGGGDHFQVTVASPQFAGLSLVDQHQAGLRRARHAARRRHDPRASHQDKGTT